MTEPSLCRPPKRTSGHLYVKTPDCRVAVTGTVFSVDSGMKGSRVAVLARLGSRVACRHRQAHPRRRSDFHQRQPQPRARRAADCLEPRPRKIPARCWRSSHVLQQHRTDSVSPAAIYERSARAVPADTSVVHQHSQPGRFSERGKQHLPRPVEAEPGAAAVVERGHVRTRPTSTRWSRRSTR